MLSFQEEFRTDSVVSLLSKLTNRLVAFNHVVRENLELNNVISLLRKVGNRLLCLSNVVFLENIQN